MSSRVAFTYPAGKIGRYFAVTHGELWPDTGAVAKNRELVLDELAAAVGEDGREAGQNMLAITGSCWQRAI